ncbi:MAG: metallophosphoesterase [Lachnospiraceae bacterium]|nr:metallophosphoesterase [Lachnospiraceae bacterium]
MKIMIVSDTHGRCQYLERAVKQISPIDMLIHLGDLEGGEEQVRAIANCPVEMVSGNNDFFTPLEREKMITIGQYRIFLTHGHRYSVSYGTSMLKEAAYARGADIVMFGHTHRPLIDMSGDVWAINPGSISQPRQESHVPTYIVMDIDRKGEAHFTLNYASIDTW